MKTRQQALRAGSDALSTIEDPDLARLEAEVLLCHQLGLSKTILYTHPDVALDPADADAYAGLIERRLRHEPVAYITRHREFFGLDFYVDQRVLVPRPETELLVEKALAWVREQPLIHGSGTSSRRRGPPSKALTLALSQREGEQWRIADVGAGSGAIAVALAVHIPAATVLAIDSSSAALAVASANCTRHHVSDRVTLVQSDLIPPGAGRFHIIAANLPYLTRAELRDLAPEVRDYEPVSALDGGEDGLDVYRRLLSQAPKHLANGGLLLMEIGADQGQAMLILARQHFPTAALEIAKDYAGLDRLAIVEN